MEIFHHYGIKLLSDEDRKAFANIGIELELGARLPWGAKTIVGLDLSESDPRWRPAQPLLEKYKITDFPFTKFSRSEIESASSLCMFGKSNSGYPQPEEDFGYLAETYDLTDYCSNCGTGYRQVRPFRLKTIPELECNVLQLNWVFDEFFVARQVWADVFTSFGIECWPVIAHKSGDEVESVVQLKIEHRVDLATRKEEGNKCEVCRRWKIPLSLIGFAPAPVDRETHICRSTQFFGSGGQAFNRIVISASLCNRIRDAKLRGVQFYPCEQDQRRRTV